MGFAELKKSIKDSSDKKQSEILQRFFKTGPGEYGEGDVFLGIKVPLLRKIAKENIDVKLDEIVLLLNSAFHEERLVALFILVQKYLKAGQEEKEKIFNTYIKNIEKINNWDLVDLSAPLIVGAYLFDKDKTILFNYAKSKNLWEKRIAILSSFYFIKHGMFDVTLRLSKILLNDTHDLIHKAAGWMLREIGKRDLRTEEDFLIKYYKNMPRTMLRYAIEKFPERKRQLYLKGKI